MGKCKWCNGFGGMHEPGDTRYYRCPDCGGNGYIPECDICGEEYEGEYCEECYAECEECGDVCAKEDLVNGICESCRS